MSPRWAATAAVVLPGCFVGYPSVEVIAPPDDTAVALDDPLCDAASMEPDDGETGTDVSQVGAATGVVRTFCGRIDKASNDGQTYTGDLDFALVHTLGEGRLSLVLSWDDGDTDLDVLLQPDPYVDQWVVGDDGTVSERVGEGILVVLVAGTRGPATNYQLDVSLD